MITTGNNTIIDNYPTYVVAIQDNLPALDPAPFGIKTRWHIDPTLTTSRIFLDLLQRLDGLTFGPTGMPMDKWLFHNCAYLPGFIYGFAAPVEELNDWEKELFKVPIGYQGPVPLSMYIAIPMLEPGYWIGHNLASLNSILPDRKLKYMATITKAMGLKAYRVEQCYGATQWQSMALTVHIRFGALDLLTAYTPLHTFSDTLTYRFPVTDNCLKAAMGDIEALARLEKQKPTANIFLADNNQEGMKELQKEIEGGKKFKIVGKALRIGKSGVIPIRRCCAPSSGQSLRS